MPTSDRQITGGSTYFHVVTFINPIHKFKTINEYLAQAYRTFPIK